MTLQTHDHRHELQYMTEYDECIISCINAHAAPLHGHCPARCAETALGRASCCSRRGAAAPAKFWAVEPSEEAVLSLGYCTSAAHPEILLGNVIAAERLGLGRKRASPALRRELRTSKTYFANHGEARTLPKLGMIYDPRFISESAVFWAGGQ